MCAITVHISVCMYSAGCYCQVLMELEVSPQTLQKKYSNMKFHEDMSSGSRDVQCGWTDGQRDTTKLTVGFRNFAKASKNSPFCPHSCIYVFCVDLRTNSLYFPIQH